MISTINSMPPEKVMQVQKLTQQLEKTFWAQMLKSSHTDQSRKNSFGMDQFQSYLVDVQAQMLSQTQSLGLAQAIQNSLLGGSSND